MKSLLIALFTLIIGIALGRFLGFNETVHQQQVSQESQITSKSSEPRETHTQKSESSAPRLERELKQNGFEADGVFGKIATQIRRYQTMSNAEFESEVELLTELKNSDRYITSYLLFTAWGEKDPHAALEYLENDELLPKGSRDHSRRIVYKSWTAQSPDSVTMNLEDTIDLNDGRRSVRYDIATISNEWLKRDKEATFNWLKSLDSEHKGRAISSYFSVLAKQDMSDARQKLTQLEGENYNEAVKEIAEHWGETMDWSTIQSEIATLPETSRNIATEEAITEFAKKNPYDATEIISALDVSDKEKYRYMKTVTAQIGTENPSATLDWALSNVEGKYQSYIADRIFGPWVVESPDEAAAWLTTQPDDAATKHMYSNLMRNSAIPDNIKESLRGRFGTIDGK